MLCEKYFLVLALNISSMLHISSYNDDIITTKPAI